MIGTTAGLPWHEGETDRYVPCPRHAGALDRLDYDAAWQYAAHRCDDCVAEIRPTAGSNA